LRKSIAYIVLLLMLFGGAAFAQPLTNGPVQYFYDNGKLLSEGTLVNGKPDGYWKSYHENGILKSEGNRKDLQLDSVWKFYNDKGIITNAISYKKGKKNGPRSSYNEAGQMVKSEDFVDDVKSGYSYTYYPTGKVQSITLFENGGEEGWAYELDIDSIIITRMQYKSGFLSFQERVNRKDKSGLKQGKWVTLFADGRIHTEVPYVDDKKNGYYREYLPNGSTKFSIFYKDDVALSNNTNTKLPFDTKVTYDKPTRRWNKGTFLDGKPIGMHVEYTDTAKFYASKIYDNGVLIGEGQTDSLGQYQGYWKEFYPTGELRAEGSYINSKRSGVWKYYQREGKLEQTGTYKNGKPNGPWKWFYESGNLLREENYVNGQEDGYSTEYADSGSTIAKGDYVMGYKQGPWIEYSGDVKMEGEYNDGEQNGIWKHYYGSGELAFEGKYSAGQPEGKHKWYYKNGKLKEEGEFATGKRNGLWRKYNEDGTLFMYTDYEYGIEKKFDGVKVKPETFPADIAD
jgi:uncharacterized protein